MRVIHFKEGREYTRPCAWGGLYPGFLTIRVTSGVLYYYTKGCKGNMVKKDSTAYNYLDFVELPLKKKEIKMNFITTTVMVTTSNNATAGFDSEDSALEWIADILETSPRCKFKMFKIYQSVNPLKVDLNSLITPIK